MNCDNHLILAAYPKRGPTPDVGELQRLLDPLPEGVRIRRLYADAGYDSEPNHQRLRDERGIRSYIPPKLGRPSDKPPSGKWRRFMKRLFCDPLKIGYSQRWQIETVNSMIKRTQGDALRGKRYHSHNRQMLLAAITHNCMILRHQSRGFQRSRTGVKLRCGMRVMSEVRCCVGVVRREMGGHGQSPSVRVQTILDRPAVGGNGLGGARYERIP